MGERVSTSFKLAHSPVHGPHVNSQGFPAQFDASVAAHDPVRHGLHIVSVVAVAATESREAPFI